jgi:hypothetical protein
MRNRCKEFDILKTELFKSTGAKRNKSAYQTVSSIRYQVSGIKTDIKKIFPFSPQHIIKSAHHQITKSNSIKYQVSRIRHQELRIKKEIKKNRPIFKLSNYQIFKLSNFQITKPSPAQPQAVQNNRNRACRHGGACQHRIQQNSECRI